MQFYITYGTVEYLNILVNKHTQLHLRLMANDDSGVLFQETDGQTIFNAPKTFEILHSTGSIHNGKSAIFHYIPVTDEGRPLFEKLFCDLARIIENASGLSAIRVLRPVRNDTYMILTLWEKEQNYEVLLQSDAYEKAINLLKKNEKSNLSYFSPSYIKKYSPVSLDDL